MAKKQKEVSFTVPTWAIWAIPSLVIVVWILNLIAAIIFSSLKSPTYGQFGDLFGVSNSLIAGLALVLVALGVHFQKQELEKTKEILEEQKKVTEAQSLALDKQNEATARQIFENTFFKLLGEIDRVLAKAKRTKLEKDIIDYKAREGEINWDEFPSDEAEVKFLIANDSIEANITEHHNKHEIVHLENENYEYDLQLELSTQIHRIREVPKSYLILANALFELLSRYSSIDQIDMYYEIFQATMNYESKRLLYYAAISGNFEVMNYDAVQLIGVNHSYSPLTRERFFMNYITSKGLTANST